MIDFDDVVTCRSREFWHRFETHRRFDKLEPRGTSIPGEMRCGMKPADE
jgi:hypothetical protein